MRFPGDHASLEEALVRGLRCRIPSIAAAQPTRSDASATPPPRRAAAAPRRSGLGRRFRLGAPLGRLGDASRRRQCATRCRARRSWNSRRDLASALAAVGNASGVPILLAGLDHPDDVIRRTFFDAFFSRNGLYLSYDPDAPRRDRLDGIAVRSPRGNRRAGRRCCAGRSSWTRGQRARVASRRRARRRNRRRAGRR